MLLKITDDKVDLISVLTELRIKWNTIFLISVSRPFDFIAVSKVLFILSLSTFGEQASFYN